MTFIIVGCFAAQLYQQSKFEYTYTVTPEKSLEVHSGLASWQAIMINQFTLLGVAPALNLQSPNTGQDLLGNATRYRIVEFVSQNPGLQFRALCGALCLPLGLAEYHLGVLVRAGLVSFVRDGRYKRFFIAKRYSKREIHLICLLRHRTARRIVEILLSKRQLSHSKLAIEVAITPQALTWQMKTLGNTEFMLQVNDGLRTIYSLDQSSMPMVQKCLAIVQ